ncbi:MAG: helix-turn-helix domain-containing protein [Propioniciclava sp.]
MATPTDRDPYDPRQVGVAIRAARTRLSLSVEALAEQADVSMGLISQLEHGKANPSLKTLGKVAAALGTTIPILLVWGSSRGEGLVRAGEGVDLPLPDQPESFHRELLTPSWVSGIQVIRTVLPAGYSNEGHAYRHLGFESVTVLTGTVEITVGDQVYRAEVGDTVNYDCAQPHWWRNPTALPTEVIGSVIPTPP